MRILRSTVLGSLIVPAALALCAGPTGAALGDVLHAVPCPGDNPADLAWVAGELYSVIFSPTEQRGIYRLDPLTGTVLGMVPYAGVMPQGLTYDGCNLWQACLTGDCLYKMHPVTGEVRATYAAPGGSDGQPLGLGWDGRWLWLADSRSPEKIWQLDTLGVCHGQIPAPGSSPYGLTWAEGFIWVSDNNTSGVAYIYKLDPATGQVLDSFACPGAGGSPNGITHDGEHLWIAVNTTDTIYQVDDGITGGAAVASGERRAAGLRLICARAEPSGRVVEVRIALDRAGRVRAELFDLAGRRQARADAPAAAAGATDLRLITEPLAAGAYYLRVTGVGERLTGKVVVVR